MSAAQITCPDRMLNAVDINGIFRAATGVVVFATVPEVFRPEDCYHSDKKEINEGNA